MSTPTTPVASLAEVTLADITVSKSNEIFRDATDFTPEALKDLAASIQEEGLAQPVLLRPDPAKAGKYILVAGERRYRSFWLLKRASIPAYIRPLNEDQALKLQIIENLQREDVNPMKEARGFELLINQKKYTTASIAEQIGKSIDYVQERIRLVQLIPEIQELVRSGEIPIKAGLKMARIPKEQQKDCLEDVTETMYLSGGYNGKGKKVVFAGLDRLQSWMDSNLWTDLSKADFDKEDPKLNPTMGACSTCPHRTRNTGGLFDDITSEDKCLLASCYRTKQVNTYKHLREQLQKKYPGKKIVFKERGGAIDAKDLFRKQLGDGKEPAEIKSHMGGVEVKEAELLKNPKAEIAVMIGIPHYDKENLSKKFIFSKPAEVGPRQNYSTSSSGYQSRVENTEKDLTPEQKKAAAQKAKDANLKASYQEAIEEQLTFEAIIKQKSPELILQAFRSLLVEFYQESCYSFDDAEPSMFKALGIDWYQDYGSKNTKRQLIKAKDADIVRLKQDDGWRSVGGDEVEATVKDLPREKLDSLMLCLLYLSDHTESVKRFKIDTKAIKQKAGSLTATWWSEEKKKRDAAKPAAAGGKAAKKKAKA
jgi:ParB/RepB/Spo0J family partition protein